MGRISYCPANKISEAAIIFAFDSLSCRDLSSQQFKDMILAAIDLFSIQGDFDVLDVTGGYEEFNDIILSYYWQRPIIVIAEMGTDGTANLIKSIDSRIDTNNIFFISTTSSAKDPFLMKPNIMRLTQLDDERTIRAYTQVFDTVVADHKIMLVDENDDWARGVGDLIEAHYNGEVLRFPLKSDIILPDGTLNALVVSSISYPTMFDILSPRKHDVVKVLFADGSSGETIPSEEYRDLLIMWQASIVIPISYANDPKITERLKAILGYRVDQVNTTSSVSAIQIASYLRDVVDDPQNYENQYFITGLEFGKGTFNIIVRVFFNAAHTEMDGTMGEILDVVVVL